MKTVRIMKTSKRIRKKNCLTKKLVNITSVGRHRLNINRSLKYISAQIIDNRKGYTIVSASSLEKEIRSKKINKTDTSTLVAELLASRAISKNIKKIYFDRGFYKYHGRVKKLVETLREKGMEI